MNNISKDTAVKISAEVREAVEAIFAKHGIAFGKINTTYGDFYKVTVEGLAQQLDENGINHASKEAQAYNQLHKLYDLPAGLLGKQIVLKGQTLTFIGIASSRKKYPYAFRKADGSTILHTEAIVPFLTGAK